MRVVDRDTLSPHDANLLVKKTYRRRPAPFQGQRTSGYPLIGPSAEKSLDSLSIASQEVASIRRDEEGSERFFRLTLVGERGNLPLRSRRNIPATPPKEYPRIWLLGDSYSCLVWIGFLS